MDDISINTVHRSLLQKSMGKIRPSGDISTQYVLGHILIRVNKYIQVLTEEMSFSCFLHIVRDLAVRIGLEDRSTSKEQ